MSVHFVVTNQAVEINGEHYGYPNNPNGTSMYIPCDQTEIIGSAWCIPQTQNGRLVGYTYTTDTGTSTPPSPDSFKVLNVKLTNTAGVTQIYFAIANTDNLATSSPPNEFAYLCDGLGGTLPVMPNVTIPTPILQTGPQSTDTTTGNNTFIFPFPDNPLGLLYTINAIYLNGTAPTPAFNPAGITTVAQVATYANAHWSGFGTWSNPSTDILQLVSTPSSGQFVTEAGIVVILTPVNFCFDLTSFSTPSYNVNGVKFGSGGIVPLRSAITLTNNNITLMNALSQVMSSGTVFNTSVANKLGILTTQAVPALYSGVTLVATAASGTC